MKKHTPISVETDGVQYRRTSTGRILLATTSALSLGCLTTVIGYISYAASLGFGISIILIGTLMTMARLFDGVTDPLISLLIDKTNTRFGKIRIAMIIGWVLEVVSMYCLFIWAGGENGSVWIFIPLYLLFYIGYTFQNMAHSMIPPVLTNDPKQRPIVSVVSTMYTSIITILASILVTMILLPRFGNQYTLDLLRTVAKLMIVGSGIFMILSVIGISPIDKPENFVASEEKQKKIGWKEMISLLKENRALQCFIFAATSDKLALNVTGQAVIGTLLYGVVIGNMGLSAIINMIAIIPALIFAFFAAKYTGKNGSVKSVTLWTRVSIYVSLAIAALLIVGGTTPILYNRLLLIGFAVLTFAQNALRIVVSTATSAMQADVIDYEAYRSGRYMPGTVTGVYSLIDKLVSSLGAVIATFCISLIGYRTAAPQPTDSKTLPVLVVCIAVCYGLPILGWVCTLIAMKKTPLSKEKMIEVQASIAALKQQNQAEEAEAGIAAAGLTELTEEVSVED